ATIEKNYLDALEAADWPNPVIAAASAKSSPKHGSVIGAESVVPSGLCHRQMDATTLIGMTRPPEARAPARPTPFQALDGSLRLWYASPRLGAPPGVRGALSGRWGGPDSSAEARTAGWGP
ncbi:hypothetical protein ACWDWU_45230, partial [Streptomyces sp. NPDC003442]